MAFTIDGIDRVEIRHDRANIASSRVPPSLGYEFVEERERAIEAPGESGVDCCWVMKRDQWAARSVDEPSPLVD